MSGRPKTTKKRITFCAPADIVEILDTAGGSMTDFICEAVRLKRDIMTAQSLMKR